MEHSRHIGYRCCIQRAEVEFGQAGAASKHNLHRCHRRSVKVGKINGRKPCPIPEHSCGAVGHFCTCTVFIFFYKLNFDDIVSCFLHKVFVCKRQLPVVQCKFAVIDRQNTIRNSIIYVFCKGFQQHSAIIRRFAAFNGILRRSDPAFNGKLYGVVLRQLIPVVAQGAGGCGISADRRFFAGNGYIAFITADKPRSRSRGSMGLAVIVERGLPPCQTDFLLRDGIVHRKLIGAIRYITNRNSCGVFARSGWSGHRTGTILLIVGDSIPSGRSGRCFESIFSFECCFGRFAVVIGCLFGRFQRQLDLIVCQIAAADRAGRRQGIPAGGISELMPMHNGIRAGQITLLIGCVDDSFGIIAGTRALRSVAADQLGAVFECITAFRFVDIPIVADPDCDKIGAAGERLRQAALPLSCIAPESTEVKLGQADAPLEHLAHVRNIGCRQMGKVNGGKRRPVHEHSCRASGQHSAVFKADTCDRGFHICERRVPLLSREAAALYRQHTVVNHIRRGADFGNDGELLRRVGRQLIPVVAQAGGSRGIGADRRLFTGNSHVAFITADKSCGRDRGSVRRTVIVEFGVRPCQADFLLGNGVIRREVIRLACHTGDSHFDGVFSGSSRCRCRGIAALLVILIVLR